MWIFLLIFFTAWIVIFLVLAITAPYRKKKKQIEVDRLHDQSVRLQAQKGKLGYPNKELEQVANELLNEEICKELDLTILKNELKELQKFKIEYPNRKRVFRYSKLLTVLIR